MKNFYSSLKEVNGSTRVGSFPLLGVYGTKFISEKNEILERWAEYFDDVSNRPSSINKTIEQLLQVVVNESLVVTPTLGKFDYPAVKHTDLTQFLRKSIRKVDQCGQVNF